jgi:hypothetical protein
MRRSLEQWKNCDPFSMAHGQSDNAKQFAFEDAKHDIILLATALQAIKDGKDNPCFIVETVLKCGI